VVEIKKHLYRQHSADYKINNPLGLYLSVENAKPIPFPPHSSLHIANCREERGEKNGAGCSFFYR
jgi:hypothetical protein